MKLCKIGVHIEALLGAHIGVISLCLCTQTKKEFNHPYQSQIMILWKDYHSTQASVFLQESGNQIIQ